MPSKRPDTAIVLATRAEAAEAHAALLVAAIRRRQLEAQRDAELDRIRAHYERFDPLHPERECVENYAARIKALRAGIEAWAFAHRAEFGDAKTLDLPDGSIQLHLGGPALRLLNRKWSWESVLDAVRAAAARGRRLVAGWIRTTEAVEKPAILAAARDGVASPSELAEFGLRVDQSERLIIRDREGNEIE